MSRLDRARSGPFIMSSFSRLRHWWPPPRPRALVKRVLGVVAAVLATAAVAAVLLLGLAGCGGPQAQTATIDVAPGTTAPADAAPADAAPASITPPAPEPVLYRLSGAGPAGATFSHTAQSFPTDVEGLLPGEWVINVEALDAQDRVVLEGTSATMVASGGPTTISVALAPVPGEGQVELYVAWPAALVAAPGVTALLRPRAGEPLAMTADLQPADGAASCTAAAVPSGWYRLELQLHDGAHVVAGRAELLQVRSATTTSAAITIAEINKPGAPITVDGASFTLYWDPPENDPADPLARYNVYYRTRGTYRWTLLGATPGATESFPVSTDILPHGSYDFAVTTVTASGAESDPHTSLDDTAQPQTGWYVVWGQ